MRILKRFEDLTFTDNYMFIAVMSDPANIEIAKGIIEIACKKKVKYISLVQTEVTENPFYDSKGVRFDVYFYDDDTNYVIEMQTYQDDLVLRARYYHDVLDMKTLNKGDDYENLKKNVVIFICTTDYFGNGEPITRTAVMNTETKEEIGDGRETIYLNTTAETDDPNTKAFYAFVQKNALTNRFTRSIDDSIRVVKGNGINKKQFMRLQDEVKLAAREAAREAAKEAAEKAREEGQQEGAIEIAKNMLQKQFSIETISELTHLSIEEIEKLKVN